MARDERVFGNFYRDSVSLMQVSATLSAMPGISQAAAVMATKGNLGLLRAAGLLESDRELGPSDLVVAVEGESSAVAGALSEAEALLTRETAPRRGGPVEIACRSIEMGLAVQPASNLALISTPGDYAGAEAQKALNLGLNVMLFSDNVTLADEVALKRLAEEKDLMVMGPDCGTAIIDGVPLGFANAVERGPIGVIAASGTGLQQITCLTDRWGQGTSQAIGTGGRDLKVEVGGITMLRGLSALGRDPDTRVIVLASKPPAKAVAEHILEVAGKLDKAVVVNFLGADLHDQPASRVHGAATLAEAAAKAVALAEGRAPSSATAATPENSDEAAARERLAPEQRYVRGLFSGGTFCYEALLLLSRALGSVHSNTPVDPVLGLDNPWRSHEHTVVDLGDDAFTRGRPHPMIDLAIRSERIIEEAGDPEVAVILLDLVLGHGAHDNPAAEMARAIRIAQDRAGEDGRQIVFVASVCGTARDPQGLERQESCLREAGVLLADSNATAAHLAGRIAGRTG